MKKQLLLLLLITGPARMLFAQANANIFYGSIYQGGTPGRTDQLFGYPPPGKTKVNLYFTELKNSGSFQLELNNIKQFGHLPNLDSILTVVKTNLAALADSLKEDGVNRRVDYVASDKNPQIRITNHDNGPKQYVIKQGELNQLKTEQDTLRIKAFAPIEDSSLFAEKLKMKPWLANNQPFFITLIVNNLSDINKLDPDILRNCVNRLNHLLTHEYIAKADPAATYRTYVYLSRNLVYPTKSRLLKNPSNSKYTELVPNIYGGLSYARGNVMPFFAAGLRYIADDGMFASEHFFAMWEPHFIFTRDASNKLITDRNDFLTVRYIQLLKRKKEDFDFVSNVSLGYLVKRSGNWFEPGTFKIGIPGVRSGWLQLEPEFYFNGLFKNFSPSLRLTLHYE